MPVHVPTPQESTPMNAMKKPSTPKFKPLGWSRSRAVAIDWLATLLPAAILLLGGLTKFRGPVESSISSTPHPELVFAIMLMFAVGLVLTCRALWRYTSEGNFLVRWKKANQSDRLALLRARGGDSCVEPVYNILSGQRPVATAQRQAALQHETGELTAHLDGQLLLPNYLAGALVGLGLVGTFVGLLGTLEDLGKLFAALMNTGNANLSPTEVFADMVRRLQEPMRSMGTAFVASLYGLLGSLVLGLNTLSASKVGRRLVGEINELVRRHEVSADSETVMQPSSDSREVLAAYRSNAEQWRALLEQINDQSQRGLAESGLLRRDVLSLAASCKELAQAVRENTLAEQEYRASVPRTRYWQEAWAKVQTYLQRSNTDQALAELGRQTQAQNQELQAMAASMKQVETLFSSYFNQQIKLTLTVDPSRPSK